METYRKKQPGLEKRFFTIISRGSVTPVQIQTNRYISFSRVYLVTILMALCAPTGSLVVPVWYILGLTLQEVIKMDVDHIENLEKNLVVCTILLLM